MAFLRPGASREWQYVELWGGGSLYVRSMRPTSGLRNLRGQGLLNPAAISLLNNKHFNLALSIAASSPKGTLTLNQATEASVPDHRPDKPASKHPRKEDAQADFRTCSPIVTIVDHTWARVKTPWPLFLSYSKPYRHFLMVIILQGNCLILLV